MLSAINICKNFGSKSVLKDVSLDVPAREVSIILGPSGCGKTTLLRCLCFLDPPDSGNILYEGEKHKFPNKLKSPLATNRGIGLVFQQWFLWPHMTNRENIEFPLRESGMTTSQVTNIIELLGRELNLTDFLNNYPYQSSAGQQQRIAIARILALKPKVLLLDEITSALDIVQINNLIKVIRNLKSLDNLAILLVTHNLDVARKIGDKILYMESGRIVEHGPIEILNSPRSGLFKKFLDWA